MNKKETLSCTLLGGNDEFLVDSAGRERVEHLSESLDPVFGQEIIEGRAQKIEELQGILTRFQQAVINPPLFGGRKCIWLKGVNFLTTSSVFARANGTQELLEKCVEVLKAHMHNPVDIVITAAPLDKRSKFLKLLEGFASVQFLESGKREEEDLGDFLQTLLEKEKLLMDADAKACLLERVGGSARMLSQEISKLAMFLSSEAGKRIDLKMVLCLVPNWEEEDFFETIEAFYSNDLAWALEALERYCAHNKDLRGLVTAFQNRNRLILQMQAVLQAHNAGLNTVFSTQGLQQHAAQLGFSGEAFSEKSTYNIFSQNPWYLKRLGQALKSFSLQRLVHIQVSLAEMIEQSLENPQEQKYTLESWLLASMPK